MCAICRRSAFARPADAGTVLDNPRSWNYAIGMTARTRTIQLDPETVERLEVWAEERGLSVAELLAELTRTERAPQQDWESMRGKGRGPWSPEVLAEDARRVAAFERAGEGVPWAEIESWMHSWGTSGELPPPKPRKL